MSRWVKVWGFRPFRIQFINRTPKCASCTGITFLSRHWPFCDPSFGLSASLGTQKQVTRQRYISYTCGGAPIFRFVMIFGRIRHLTDVINRAKFCIDLSKGFRLKKGSKSRISHRKPQWLLPCWIVLTRDLLFSIAVFLKVAFDFWLFLSRLNTSGSYNVV